MLKGTVSGSTISLWHRLKDSMGTVGSVNKLLNIYSDLFRGGAGIIYLRTTVSFFMEYAFLTVMLCIFDPFLQ